MNSFLLVLGILLVITPVTVLAQMDNLTDLPSRFNPRQLATMSGLARSGITFIVIALAMMMWI